MPVCFWGDEDGSRYRESYFDVYPGVWRHGDWIEITVARHRDHLRPLRLDDQPRRRPHGDERDLPRRARARRGRRRARRRPPARGHGRLAVALRRPARRAPCSTTSSSPRSSSGSARTARRATSPTRSARSPRSRARSRARSSRCPVKRILMGAAARPGREPRLAREPARARLVRRPDDVRAESILRTHFQNDPSAVGCSGMRDALQDAGSKVTALSRSEELRRRRTEGTATRAQSGWPFRTRRHSTS